MAEVKEVKKSQLATAYSEGHYKEALENLLNQTTKTSFWHKTIKAVKR